jgi:hypothetical protein
MKIMYDDDDYQKQTDHSIMFRIFQHFFFANSPEQRIFGKFE